MADTETWGERLTDQTADILPNWSLVPVVGQFRQYPPVALRRQGVIGTVLINISISLTLPQISLEGVHKPLSRSYP